MKFIKLGFALWGFIHFYTAHAVEFLNQSYGPHHRQTFDLFPQDLSK